MNECHRHLLYGKGHRSLALIYFLPHGNNVKVVHLVKHVGICRGECKSSHAESNAMQAALQVKIGAFLYRALLAKCPAGRADLPTQSSLQTLPMTPIPCHSHLHMTPSRSVLCCSILCL